jgi:hypothetical protein
MMHMQRLFSVVAFLMLLVAFGQAEATRPPRPMVLMISAKGHRATRHHAHKATKHRAPKHHRAV